MKAALISLGSVSSKMTAEAMKKYFESVDSLNLQDIEVHIGREGFTVLYEGEKIRKYDCIYLKGSYKYESLMRAMTTALYHDTRYMPIKASSFTVGHNKLLTHIKLREADIPMPTTYLAATARSAKGILEAINYPIVMKLPAGTQGKGVMFADSYPSASSLLDALMAIKQPFIIQEYVESGGVDIRAFVVGDKVVAAMKRKAQHGEKRSNIHVGGKGESVELDSKTKAIAVKVAKALNADICGVDIIESVKGPLVLEVNLSPGIQGISAATSINIADEIAKFLFRKFIK